MTITFDELRYVKHQLPTGSIRRIANMLKMHEQSIRNYFGAKDYSTGMPSGNHVQPGPGGGIVSIYDTTILDLARDMISEA